MRSASGPASATAASAPSMRQSDQHDVADRAEPRELPQRNPGEQDEYPSDDDDGPDRPPDPARHALMKDVPRIESEARSHHEGAGRPVQNQANVELSKPPHQAVHRHGTHYVG